MEELRNIKNRLEQEKKRMEEAHINKLVKNGAKREDIAEMDKIYQTLHPLVARRIYEITDSTAKLLHEVKKDEIAQVLKMIELFVKIQLDIAKSPEKEATEIKVE